MAKRKPQLSPETIDAAIGAIESSIEAGAEDKDLDKTQRLYDARRELLALRGNGDGAEKPKRTYTRRKRGLPEGDEATA